MITLITHSHVQKRSGPKQGNLDVFGRRDAVSGSCC
jgi:hypothetical protein